MNSERRVSLTRICVLFLATLGWARTQKAVTPTAKECGPQNYCARTDRRVAPYQKTAPNIGPAGSIIHDPDFESRILRVTDANSDPNGMGRSLMTPSSAEQNAWNADSSRFYVETPGGQFVLYEFDPVSLKVRKGGVIKAPWWAEPEFSYTRRDILYGIRRIDPAFQEYDVSNGRVTLVHKISDCAKLGPRDFGFDPGVSADDRRLSAVLGPEQDRNFLVYVYDRKRGCRWYNTQTGEIGGQWGPKGTISSPDRYSVHNIRISKSGDFVWIQRGASRVGRNWLVWTVDTMNVVACSTLCSGHHAMGYSHLVGPSGEKHPLDLLLRPLNQLAAVTPLVAELGAQPSVAYWYDQHFSWNNADPEDKNPVCLSTYSVNNPDHPGAPLEALAPWQNEILCVETDGEDSKVWRFAHTYSTAKNGFWSTPRGNVSQDGRFFLYTSDWQDQLGARPRNRRGYRIDVFVVELR